MAEELPDPLVPPECDLRNCRRMPIDVVRLRASELQVELTAEEKWYALELWMAAFHQVPAASLPDDDAKLAYLCGLGRDKRTWNRVRAKVLRGWVRCAPHQSSYSRTDLQHGRSSSAADVRFYHPVLAEICLEVWNSIRAKKRGAKLTNEKRWGSQAIDKQQNKSRTASRSIYNERHAKRAHSETQSDTVSDTLSDQLATRSAVATEGKDISFPLPPPSSEAGSGCADAPPARPPRRSQAPKPAFTDQHGVEQADGRVCVHWPEPKPDGGKPERLLWINGYGGIDEVTLAKNPQPFRGMANEDAMKARNAAVAWRAGQSADDIGPTTAVARSPPAPEAA